MKHAALAILLAAACHKSAPDQVLVLGKTPAPFGPFAALTPGMTSEAAIAAVPALTHQLDAKGYGSIDWHVDGADGDVQLAHGHAEAISIRTKTITPAQVVAAWGPGELEPAARLAYETRRYLDPTTHVRTDVVSDPKFPTELDWVYYTSAADLFAGPADTFDGVAAIGRPVDEATAAFEKHGVQMQDASGDQRFLRLPATDLGHDPTTAIIVKDGIVVRIDCYVPIDKPEHRAALVALLQKKLGTTPKVEERSQHWEAGDFAATLRDGDHNVVEIFYGKTDVVAKY